MKVIKLYGAYNEAHAFALQGVKTIYSDGTARNNTQTVMAVINWLRTKSVPSWLWDDHQPLRWDDNTTVNL